MAFVRGLEKAEAILCSMVDEIRDYGILETPTNVAPDCLSFLELICANFNLVARQLRNRHAGRATLEIEDEYDVQDLLHALLKLHFEDIRPEEWSPSYAGKGSRLDFLLKRERIVVEVKKTRRGLNDARIGEELLIDRERYSKHPDCDTLVCFIYDPEGRIGNPRGLEHDLEDNQGQLIVRVIVAPHF